MPNETAIRSYERVAWWYEKLAHCLSFGRIFAAKASQIAEIEPGDRVLYVGVGSGEDALLAAERGAAVTCLDLSRSMLERTRDRMEAAGVRADFVCGDVMDHEVERPYDAIAANFFLNVFPAPLMEEVLAKLVSLTRPGGKILIADFAPPRGNAFQRAFQRLYYRTADVVFWAIRLAPLHPIYDYEPALLDLGLEVEPPNDFRIAPFAGPTYRCLVARRAAERRAGITVQAVGASGSMTGS